MDKETENYVERLYKHQESCEERSEYAMKRLDVMIVALSSSGLLLCFNDLKDHPAHSGALAVPIVCFVLAILINVLSQWLGYYANEHENAWTEGQIEKEKNQSKEKKKKRRRLIANEAEQEGILSFTYGKWTNRTNKLASAILGIGVLVLLGLFIFSVAC